MSTLGHHLRVIRKALAEDARRRAETPRSDHHQFLPAALEVVEQPVSPTGRRTVWALLALLVATLAWLVLGQVDTVASAPGRVIAVGNSKLVQSAATGVVAAIHVRDGDAVKQGEVLIDLDTKLASAELEQAQRALLADQLDAERSRAFVAALDGGGIHFHAPAGTPPEVAATQLRLIAAQLSEVGSTVAGYAAARRSADADAHAAAATRAKLDATLPILDREVGAMKELDAQGFAPGMRLLELERQRRSDEGDREVAVAQQERGLSEAGKYGEGMAQTRDQSRRQALAELAKAEADGIVRAEDVTKAARRAGLQHLASPAAGTVQQLAIHTVGGVVEAAKPLMVIVPSDGAVEIEAHVLNRDIGFVHEGQRVAVKLEAFPFTRYGTVPGTVTSLSHDAVPDPRLGANYIARIHLARASITANGQKLILTPGLAVTADIRTGRRTIMSWLLSPLQTTIAEAGHEH